DESAECGVPLRARQLPQRRYFGSVAAVEALVRRRPRQLFAARPQGAREPGRARVQGRLLGVPDGRATLRHDGTADLDADLLPARAQRPVAPRPGQPAGIVLQEYSRLYAVE